VVKKSILANSDTVCLLDQGKFRDSFEEIAKLLSLSEVEKSKIFTINRLDNRDGRSRFKEVYIKRGATGEVYGVEVPLEEYLTYTTERSEKEAISVYRGQGESNVSFSAAVEALARDFRGSRMEWTAFVRRVNQTEKTWKEWKN
jgi:hypothetical protein